MAKKDFIDEITKIKGISKAKAELLYDNGFDSIAKLKKANIKDLTKIEGMTDIIAKKIKAEYQEKPKKTAPKEAKPKKTETKKPKKEEKYEVKIKPKLTKELEKSLIIRKQIKKRTPEFLREEWFRYKKIPRNWRKPDGITSKMRINLKYRPSKVRVGFSIHLVLRRSRFIMLMI